LSICCAEDLEDRQRNQRFTKDKPQKNLTMHISIS
jgi:hypothetical protein